MSETPGLPSNPNPWGEFPSEFLIERYTTADRVQPEDSDVSGRDEFTNPMQKLSEHVRDGRAVVRFEQLPDSEVKHRTLEAQLSAIERSYATALDSDSRPDSLLDDGLDWHLDVRDRIESALVDVLIAEYEALHRNQTPIKAQHVFHALKHSGVLMEFLGYERVKPIMRQLRDLARIILEESEDEEDELPVPEVTDSRPIDEIHGDDERHDDGDTPIQV